MLRCGSISTLQFVKWSTVLVIAVLGILFFQKNLTELSTIFKTLDCEYLLGAVTMAVIANVMAVYKLSITLNYAVGLRVNFSEWMYVYIKSYLLNNFIPLSGLIYRGSYLKKKYNFSYTNFIAASYVFALVGLGVLLFLSASFLAAYDHRYSFMILMVGFLLIAIIKLSVLNNIAGRQFKSHKLSFYINKLDSFSKLILAIYQKGKLPAYLMIFIVGAFIDFFVYAIAYCGLIKSTSFESIIYIYIAYSLSWIIRITPGNIGIQEFIISTVGSLTGLGVMSGVLLSLLLRFVNLAGAFLLWGVLSLNLAFKKE